MSELTDEQFIPAETSLVRHDAHCGKCGRFARVVHVPTAPDITGDWSPATGVCNVHGCVDIYWGKP